MTHDEMAKAITYLLDREAIRDVVATYSRGVDRLDPDILRSVYHEDAVDDHAMFVGGPEAFREWVFAMHSEHHKTTQHFLGNHLAEIDGEVAHAETYYVWYGMNRNGPPFSMMGGRYLDRLEKREGKWAIVERITVTDFMHYPPGPEQGGKKPEGEKSAKFLQPHQLEAMAGAPQPSRDRSDPSYARPMHVSKGRLEQFAEILRKHGIDS